MASSSPRTVLVLDDDALLGDAVRDLLSGPDLEVLVARSGAEGLALCRSRLVDVVLLDQKLPDCEGHTLCAALLEANADTKIVFATSYPSFDNALKAIRAGAFDYLSKPFEPEELRVAIERCLATLRLERTELAHAHHRAHESAAAALVGRLPGLAEVARLVPAAGASDAPVLITGETGSGKGVVARAIHYAGQRRSAEFVTANCAALPESLIEAELFGHERGAFTGAVAARAGLFELAEGGTLFLDEIGEMPFGLQSRLLNVLEEKCIRRLGGRLARRVDFRVVSATNADLAREVEARRFRADLFYRLDVLRIHVPPLRDRRTDIPVLCTVLLERMADRASPRRLAAGELEQLLDYGWPGNVRELANVIERSMLLQQGEVRPSAFLGNGRRVSADVPTSTGEPLTLAALEHRHIVEALERASGNLSRAARALGISLSTLKRRVKSLGRGRPAWPVGSA